MAVQSRNRRDVIKIFDIDENLVSVQDVATQLAMKPADLYYRLRGWRNA